MKWVTTWSQSPVDLAGSNVLVNCADRSYPYRREFPALLPLSAPVQPVSAVAPTATRTIPTVVHERLRATRRVPHMVCPPVRHPPAPPAQTMTLVSGLEGLEDVLGDVAQLRGRAGVRDRAVAEHDDVIGQPEGVGHVLLDEQDRRARVPDPGEVGVHLVD